VRSVEFHPDAQDELIQPLSSTKPKRKASGSTSSRQFSRPTTAFWSSQHRARGSTADSDVFSFQSFHTVSCIASSLSASTSSRSCTFTVGQATGAHDSDRGLPNNMFDRTVGAHSLAAAGQRES
jgi:hypothetical protein